MFRMRPHTSQSERHSEGSDVPCAPGPRGLHQNLPSLGNRLLEGANRTLCTRTQEKGAVTPRETAPDLPVSAQEPQVEAWVRGGLPQGRQLHGV